VARSLEATGRDIYDAGTSRRSVLELAAALRPGDSGSALVDPAGQVVGVAFAIARDQAGVAYALDLSELRAVLAEQSPDAVPTGSCIA
jgi:S1-C subfamily serine protease